MNKPFGMIFYPGMRALAYLWAFRTSGVLPSQIVMLTGTVPNKEEIIEESRRHNYNRHYFDTDINPDYFCRDNNINTTYIEATGINDLHLEECLKSSSITTWIFTGGGILSQRLLSIGKNFLHIHPGRLPDYRGSTTFYYSIIEEGSLQATAFYMGGEIDEGPVLAEESFRFNIQVRPDQPHFMDSILDPFIRAAVLEKLLTRYNGAFPAGKQPTRGSRLPYFIIHPLLRNIAILHLNRLYCPKLPEGIFIVGEAT